MDYKIGDIVLYGSDGMCRISDVTEKKVGEDILKYLILSSVYNESSTIFVPLANEKLLGKVRCLPAENDLADTLEKAYGAEVEWIADDAERKERFYRILETGDTYNLIGLLKSIYMHRTERISIGKKLHVLDERIMKDAERVLADEVSYILGVDRDDANSYVRSKLGYTIDV